MSLLDSGEHSIRRNKHLVFIYTLKGEIFSRKKLIDKEPKRNM